MTYYTVPEIETTYYEILMISVRTWKGLGAIPVRTWAALKKKGWTTWKKLGDARNVTSYYLINAPSTTYYEVIV